MKHTPIPLANRLSAIRSRVTHPDIVNDVLATKETQRRLNSRQHKLKLKYLDKFQSILYESNPNCPKAANKTTKLLLEYTNSHPELSISDELQNTISRIYNKTASIEHAVLYRSILNNHGIKDFFFTISYAVEQEQYEIAIPLFWDAVEYYKGQFEDAKMMIDDRIRKVESETIQNGYEPNNVSIVNGARNFIRKHHCHWLVLKNDDDLPFENATMLLIYMKLNALNLLFMASERGDGEQVIKIIQLLLSVDENCLTEMNYSKLLISALNFKDYTTCKVVFELGFGKVEYTQSLLIPLAKLFIKNDDVELGLVVVGLIEDMKTKKALTLDVVSKLGDSTKWLVVDELVSDGVTIGFDDLVCSEMHYVNSDLDLSSFESLEKHLQTLSSFQNELTGKLFIYSLFKLLVENNVGLKSFAFVTKYLVINKKLDYFQADHFKLICYSLNLSGLKSSSFWYLNLSAELGIKLTLNDYYSLMKCQLHGESHKTLYLVIIKALEAHGKLNQKAVSLLQSVASHTNDTALFVYLSQLDDITIDEAKRLFKYDDVHEDLTCSKVASQHDHDVIAGYGKYSESYDLGTLNMLKS